MQRIVIMIEDGQLTGVYREHDAEDVMVDLLDYDNLKASDDEADYAFAEEVETDIEVGKLIACW